MRSLFFGAKLAVIGIAAALAVFALSYQAPSSMRGQSLQALDNTFATYLARHGKSYATKEEYEYRRGIFEKTLELVAEQNSQNTESYFLTINKFADMTQFELDQSMGALVPNATEEDAFPEFSMVEGPEGELLGGPVDWRGVMNPVRDQGQCGSCWAFASIASVEGRWAVKRGAGESIQLSEQQLVDCSAQNNACNGGWPAKAFTFLKVYGAQPRDQYPYTAVRGACKYQASAVVAKVTNIYSISSMDAALASGPVPVYVQVTNSFRQYGGGIFNGVCGSAINHAVTAVGYGTENGKTYYIIRNSWGTGWGEGGHIRVLANGNCGIYKNVFPTVN